ncbi:uncharacterized protein LOC119441880 [Dermacentor silvarum]|uniref:uncharacterized protein LOC119441880 n=1 Tax=Dermacentor silvarum TaxID=543639 RepID=UPI001899F4EF|nr:uncharacterized protein LOC119441880 [Dermacentor silvarum]
MFRGGHWRGAFHAQQLDHGALSPGEPGPTGQGRGTRRRQLRKRSAERRVRPAHSMGFKDTLPHCSTKRALRTVEGARHHAVVVARGAGLLLLYSDLFNTSEVCRLWQVISLGLLRRKLRYLCYCHIKSEEKCQTTASGLPKFLEDFCRDLRRFIQIAQQAGCSPTFGFLSYSSNPKDEKAVVQQVQSNLSPRCVVVYHRSKTITMRPRDDPTKACSVHRGITGAFLFGPSPPTPCHRRPSSNSSNSSSSRRAAAAVEAGSSKSCPATEAPDVPAPRTGASAVSSAAGWKNCPSCCDALCCDAQWKTRVCGMWPRVSCCSTRSVSPWRTDAA